MIDDDDIDGDADAPRDDDDVADEETATIELSGAPDADASPLEIHADHGTPEPGSARTVDGGRGLVLGVLACAVVLSFLLGAALGKGFAPSQGDAAIARIDARDTAREQAHDEAYEAAYEEAFAAEKKRGTAAGTRQGTIEGKRSGMTAASKQAPTAAPVAPVVDCPSFDLSGVDYGGGAGYFDISVRGMQCQEAKNLILAAGYGGNFAGLTAHGWSCQNLGSEGETNQFRCSDARNRVFRWWSGA